MHIYEEMEKKLTQSMRNFASSVIIHSL